MKKIARASNEKGFSLIEVLMAMGIFAIGSLAVAALYYSTSTGIRNSNELTEAVFIAEDYLNQTLALRYRNLNPTPCTDCMAPVIATEGKYNISVTINPIPANLTAGSTATITVTVSWAKLGASASNDSYTIQYIRAESKNTGV